MSRTRDESRASAAALLYAAGRTCADVAGLLHVDERTVRRWLGPGRLRPPGAPRKAGVDDALLHALAAGGVPVAEVARRAGLSRGAVRRRLGRAGPDR